MICYLWYVYCVHRAFRCSRCFTYAYLYVALKMCVFIFERWMSLSRRSFTSRTWPSWSQLLKVCNNFQHKSNSDSLLTELTNAIHPSSTAYVGLGSGGSSLSRGAQTSLSPATSSSSSQGDPEAFPGQLRDMATKFLWILPKIQLKVKSFDVCVCVCVYIRPLLS